MKLLLENWRKYINEVSFSDAKVILDSKRTLKIIKAYRYNKEQEHPDYPDAGITTQHRNFKNYLLDMIPDDLTDNQKGTSILWLLKVAREDPKVAANLINGRIKLDTPSIINAINQSQPRPVIKGVTLLKISGIWETDINYGLSYKFIVK